VSGRVIAVALAAAALAIAALALPPGDGGAGDEAGAPARGPVAPGPAGGASEDPFEGLQEQIDQWIAAGGNPAEVFPMGAELDRRLRTGTPDAIAEQVQKIRTLVSTVPPPLPTTPRGPVPVRVRRVPEAAEIAFHSPRSGLGPEVFTMQSDGSNPTQLTFLNPRPYDQPYEHVAVSFDRRLLAVNRYLRGGAGPTGVWLIDLVHGLETRVAPDFFTAGHGGVDWSPDGTLYFAGRASAASKTGVYRAAPGGGPPTALFVLEASDPGYVGDVSVSDDGSMIAYVRAVVPDPASPHVLKTQIWVAGTDGTGRRMVDDGGPELGSRGGFPIGDFDPELSPDNRHVVFSRTNTRHVNYADSFATAHDLWLAPLDRSAPARRITREGPISIVPDWREGAILFTEINESDGYAGLALIHPDGSGYRRIGPSATGRRDFGSAGKWIPRVTVP
jgi:Tol biopolymer transport system component